MNQTQKWIAGVVAVLFAALISGGIAWAQDAQGDLERLDERTRGIEEMRRDVAAIQRDVARICGHLGIEE
jgi:type II secretory pathway component PulJ